LRYLMMDLLQKEQRLQQVVKLVGPDVLPQTQRLVLEVCHIFKNTFLQQAAFDKVDTYSSAKKQFLMLKTIVDFYHVSEGLLQKGVTLAEIKGLGVYQDVIRMKLRYTEDDLESLAGLSARIADSVKELEF